MRVSLVGTHFAHRRPSDNAWLKSMGKLINEKEQSSVEQRPSIANGTHQEGPTPRLIRAADGDIELESGLKTESSKVGWRTPL